MRNVHVYDTKLKDVYDHRSEIKISNNGKKKLITKLSTLVKSPEAKKMLNIIIEDIGNPLGPNFDTANKIDCTDVLCSILIRKMSRVILNLLEEQLKDNYNLGRCPQGRSTRLLQIYQVCKNIPIVRVEKKK